MPTPMTPNAPQSAPMGANQAGELPEALLPCPFCGAAAHFEADSDGWHWIECESCGMQGNRSASLMEDCKPKLREAWNTRNGVHPDVASGYAKGWEDGMSEAAALLTAAPAAQPALLGSDEREAIIRAAVAAMPHTDPLVADDLLEGYNMHTEADDILAIWRAARAHPAAAQWVLCGWQINKTDKTTYLLRKGQRGTTVSQEDQPNDMLFAFLADMAALATTSVAALTVPEGPMFTTPDADLNDLLEAAHYLKQPRASTDDGVLFMDAMEKVMGRLAAPQPAVVEQEPKCYCFGSMCSHCAPRPAPADAEAQRVDWLLNMQPHMGVDGMGHFMTAWYTESTAPNGVAGYFATRGASCRECLDLHLAGKVTAVDA